MASTLLIYDTPRRQPPPQGKPGRAVRRGKHLPCASMRPCPWNHMAACGLTDNGIRNFSRASAGDNGNRQKMLKGQKSQKTQQGNLPGGHRREAKAPPPACRQHPLLLQATASGKAGHGVLQGDSWRFARRFMALCATGCHICGGASWLRPRKASKKEKPSRSSCMAKITLLRRDSKPGTKQFDKSRRPGHVLSYHIEPRKLQQQLLLARVLEVDRRLGVLACPLQLDNRANAEPLVFDDATLPDAESRPG